MYACHVPIALCNIKQHKDFHDDYCIDAVRQVIQSMETNNAQGKLISL